MNNKRIKLGIMLLVCSLTSCSDFLDVQPLGSFSEDAVFSDAKFTEAYVNQRYVEMRDGFGNIGLRYISDEAYHNFNSGSPYLYNRGEVTPDQYGNYGTWGTYFAAIKTVTYSLRISAS